MNTSELSRLLDNVEELGGDNVVDQLLDVVRRDHIPAGKAVRQIDRAMKTFRRLWEGQPEGISANIRVVLNLAESYENLGGFDQARTSYEEALGVARAENDQIAEADILKKMGRVLRKQGKWKEALRHIADSRVIHDTLSNDLGVATCRVSEGIVHFERGDYPSAGEAYRFALEIAEQLGNRRIAASANLNIGILENIAGNFEQATANFSEALMAAQQQSYTALEGRAYHNLGMCGISREDWASALDAFEQALQISEGIGDLALAASSYVQKAQVYLRLNDRTLSAAYCTRALDIFQEVDRPLGKAEALRILGRLVGSGSAYRTGRGLLDESLDLYVRFENPLGEAEVRREIGILESEQGNPEEARTHLIQAVEIFDRLGARVDVERTQALIEGLSS